MFGGMPDFDATMRFHENHERQYDPYYVYGFKDDYRNCRDKLLPNEAIEAVGLQMYGLDVVRLHLGDVVYGINIPVGARATPQQQELVKAAMKKLTSTFQMGECTIGYFAAMQGSYRHSEREHYIRKPQ